MEKRRAFIEFEGVPNPQAIKLVVKNGILTDEPYIYSDWSKAESAPLAKKLLMLRYVDEVFINYNYVSVLKKEDSPEWDNLLPELRMMIQQHLEDNEPILYLGAEKLEHPKTDDVVLGMAQELLDKKLRPYAHEDGGDFVIESYEDGVLNLRMHGACKRCPYAAQTLKEGVEKLLNTAIPEIKKVVALDNNVLS
ncbi:MAG: NifU family protein [Bacteroidia bacterium]|nr:NifU family protein [Bacteroidia bacterium]